MLVPLVTALALTGCTPSVEATYFIEVEPYPADFCSDNNSENFDEVKFNDEWDVEETLDGNEMATFARIYRTSGQDDYQATMVNGADVYLGTKEGSVWTFAREVSTDYEYEESYDKDYDYSHRSDATRVDTYELDMSTFTGTFFLELDEVVRYRESDEWDRTAVPQASSQMPEGWANANLADTNDCDGSRCEIEYDRNCTLDQAVTFSRIDDPDAYQDVQDAGREAPADPFY